MSLCLVSILQNTKYEIKDDMKKIITTGHLGLIKGSDHSLCLETHEDKDDAYFVCYLKLSINEKWSSNDNFLICEDVLAIRENGKTKIENKK